MAFDLPKRIFFGRPLRSDALGHTLLPKKLALPVFSSDPLSSVAYATEEILLVLGTAGLAFYDATPWIMAGIVLLLAAVTVSYRQTVHAYPNGGGAYIVAHENLGENAGLIAASSLLIDYVLTVSVSVAAGVFAITSAVPSLAEHRVSLSIGFIVFVTVMNLRGVKESGRIFAVPTYGFVLGIYVMLTVGFAKLLFGGGLVAETAHETLTSTHKTGGLLTAFLLLKAFSSGCTALTGVEAISNGVPAFKKPAADNAAKTLLMMAAFSITMFVGITVLAMRAHVHVSEAAELHRSVVAQIAAAVFGDGSFGFFYVQAFTAGILILAANTAYQDFPRLSSILAQDRYLPRQLHNRGDRLVFSNGIVVLAVFASLLVWVFDAEVTRLIKLYIVGVFVSFSLSQFGMVRHWDKLRSDPDADLKRIARSRLLNALGGLVTSVVLVIVLISKFRSGAWIVVITAPFLFAVMKGIHRHYERVAKELRLASTRPVLASRNHAVVLVSQLHNPTLRALNYAKSIKPHTLEAVYVEVDEEDTRKLHEDWDRAGIDVPLKVLGSPYREITKPVLDYIRNVHRDSPRDVVTVVIPEYVVGKWWEQLLHNQSALRIKAFLLFQPGVMVTSVPWHLSSSPEPEEPAEAQAGSTPTNR